MLARGNINRDAGQPRDGLQEAIGGGFKQGQSGQSHGEAVHASCSTSAISPADLGPTTAGSSAGSDGALVKKKRSGSLSAMFQGIAASRLTSDALTMGRSEQEERHQHAIENTNSYAVVEGDEDSGGIDRISQKTEKTKQNKQQTLGRGRGRGRGRGAPHLMRGGSSRSIHRMFGGKISAKYSDS